MADQLRQDYRELLRQRNPSTYGYTYWWWEWTTLLRLEREQLLRVEFAPLLAQAQANMIGFASFGKNTKFGPNPG